MGERKKKTTVKEFVKGPTAEAMRALVDTTDSSNINATIERFKEICKRYKNSPEIVSKCQLVLGRLCLQVSKMEENPLLKEKWNKLSIKYFKAANAKSSRKGYSDAALYLLKYKDEFIIDENYLKKLEKMANKNPEAYIRVLDNYFDFNEIMQRVSDVLNGIRPLFVEDQGRKFQVAKKYITQAKEKLIFAGSTPSSCLIGFGMCLILEGYVKEGVKFIKDNYEAYREENDPKASFMLKEDKERYYQFVERLESDVINRKLPIRKRSLPR